MKWFNKIFKKKYDPWEVVEIDDINSQVHPLITEDEPEPKSKPKPKFEYPDIITHPKDCVIKSGGYSWFKCKMCGKKVKSNNNENMFYYVSNGDYYNAHIIKWCKGCLSEIYFLIGGTQKDIDAAQARMIVRKLKGEDDD